MTLVRRTFIALCIASATALAVVALGIMDEGRVLGGLVEVYWD
jgi:hypothetical protein